MPAAFNNLGGLPFGITLFAKAFTDAGLCRLGGEAQPALVAKMGATGIDLPARDSSDDGPQSKPLPVMVRVAVCGAHMSGLPLNHQLTGRGGVLERRSKTAPRYRLFALNGFRPPRPGMLRAESGAAIEVEVWQVSTENFGSFVDAIPGPLGIGTIELEDGETLRGFLCESYAVEGAEEITQLGSWRTYVAKGQVICADR